MNLSHVFFANFNDGYEYIQKEDDSSILGEVTAFGDFLKLIEEKGYRSLKVFGILCLESGRKYSINFYNNNGYSLCEPIFDSWDGVVKCSKDLVDIREEDEARVLYYRSRVFELSGESKVSHYNFGCEVLQKRDGFSELQSYLVSIPVN